MGKSSEKEIVIVGGSKGGVGKSAVAAAAIDTVQDAGESALLIESDNSNPDVMRAYQSLVAAAEQLDLDDRDGWIRLLTLADQHRDKVIIVNTAARNNVGVEQFGALLNEALPELERPLTTLWVINRQRDSLELVKRYRQTISAGALHVVRNLYFGAAEKFDLYNTSKTKAEVEATGGRTIDFPDCADRVMDLVVNKRLALSQAAKELDFGERIELQRYRNEARKALVGVL